jgi:integrase
VRRFLEASRGTRFEALFVLAVTSGMREGELLGLRWRDLDLEASVLQVRHAMQRLNGKWEFVEPKSAKSRRTIVLNGLAAEALRRHRTKQTAERLRNGPSWEDWDLVFANEIGKPMEVGNLTNRYFRPLLKLAGLPQIRFHDLRHSAATLMLGANVNVKIVSEMLGHAQSSFTMDRYQHVSLAMQREAAQAIEAALS